jgi:putative membrane protein insertion efficiency factor
VYLFYKENFINYPKQRNRYIAKNIEFMGVVRKIISWILVMLVKFYQSAISPLFPSACRYTPTCSTYMIQAIKIHGPWKGFIMGLKRFSRCHPWGGSGFDPVPPKEHKHE